MVDVSTVEIVRVIRVYDCAASGPCPHSTKKPRKNGKGIIYGPKCPTCYAAGALCLICSERIERGEAWIQAPALGPMHRRKCVPDGWKFIDGRLPKHWRSAG